MTVYLSNAFSLQMQGESDCIAKKISLGDAKKMVLGVVPGPYIDRESEKDGSDAVCALIAQSCVGHADIASILSHEIGFEIVVNRVSIALKPGDVLIVGQYVGSRLSEGATQLPEGAKIEWYEVRCRRPGTNNLLDAMYCDLEDAAINCDWLDEGKRLLVEVAKKYFPKYFSENAYN